MKDAPVSLFRRANRPDDVGQGTIGAVLDGIRTGRWADPVAAVRAVQAKDERKRLKLGTLPAAAFSGTFSRRANDALLAHSGFVCLDFDDVADPRTLRDQLAQHPHVAVAWVSVSGTGVKALVPVEIVDPGTGECRTPADDAEHKAACAEVFALFPDASLDQACKDVARLCYVSHDPDLRTTPEAPPVTVKLVQKAEEAAPSPSMPKMGDDVPLTLGEIATLLSFLRRPAASGDYDYWLSVYANLIAFCEDNGHSAEDARRLMEAWSPARERGDYPPGNRDLRQGQAGAFVNLLKAQGLAYRDWLRDRYARLRGEEIPRERRGNGERPPPSRPAAGLLGVCVAEVERQPIRWLWHGRLALGKLAILDGDPGLGKSTVYLDTAARVTTGRAWADGQENGEAGSVVIVTTEDGVGDTIRPRLEEAGADLARVRVIQTIPTVRDDGTAGTPRVPKLPQDVERIFGTCRAIGARLLIIDPLTAHLGGNTNSYKDQDIRGALAPVAEAAERYGVAVLVVRHLNKGGGGKAIYRGGGSIGIIGAARIGLMVGKDPNDAPADGENQRCVLASVKNNIGRPAASLAYRIVSSENDASVGVVQWEGTSALSANDLCQPEKPTEGTARDEATEFLEEQLAGGTRLAREVYAEAEALGIAERTLKRAKKRLGVTAERQGFGAEGGWYWSLPVLPKGAKESQRVPPSEVAPNGDAWPPLRSESTSVSEDEKPVSSAEAKPLQVGDSPLADLAEQVPVGDFHNPPFAL